MLHKELNPASNYSPIAVKLLICLRVCPLESLLISLLHQENIRGSDPPLGHKQSLVSCLWEIFEDPAVALAVLHLDSLNKETDHHVILELSTLSHHLLSEIFSLSRILSNELLDYFVHFKVYKSYLLSHKLTKGRLS